MDQEQITRCIECRDEMRPCHTCMIAYHTARVQAHVQKTTEAEDLAKSKRARDRLAREEAKRKRQLPATARRSRPTPARTKQLSNPPPKPITLPPKREISPPPLKHEQKHNGSCLVADCQYDANAEKEGLCIACWAIMQLWHKYGQKPELIPITPTGSQISTFKQYFSDQRFWTKKLESE